MVEQVRFHLHPLETPNFFDKILERSLLKLIPQKVVPNHITLFRYVSIPFILYFLTTGYSNWGVTLFFISAFSDAVDGALARTRNKITDWGKIHDPLADKLLISSVGAIVVTLYLSFYIIAAIIFIEILLILNALLKMKKGMKIISALWPGKVKMVLQSFGIAFALLFIIFPYGGFLTLAAYLLYLAIFFALLSLVVYGSI